MKSSEIKFSIIISVLNESKLIVLFLETINKERKGLKYNMEIIIVDGNSSDDTIKICSNYQLKILNSSRVRRRELT